ncbi:MAG: hypothetical protein IID07_06760 [Gemmatimonadetes bacterium]|nr:hypothetical protein [Gemmatimonadota bacterium]
MCRKCFTPWVAAALFAAGPAAAQDLGVDLHGFAEFGVGTRIRDDPLQPDDILMSEARFRLEFAHFTDDAEFAFKGDFVADGLTEEVDVDIRQAAIILRAADWLDVRAGRQILTWGTGDLLFLNDLFPKDFVSFFIGRDDEYLKAPANALRFTFYSSLVNLDLVATPVFEPDRSITGVRLSFFDRGTGALENATSMGGPLTPALPPRELGNGELAARFFRRVGGYELALYGYVGFTKQPLAFDLVADLPTYSPLNAYGASVRGPAAGGIAHFETVLYDGDDETGDDPNIPNSQFRGLMGYERELAPNLTGSAQYYVEHILNYDRLLAASPNPEFEPSETRHLITARLTYRLLQQTLTVSLFAFASPNDEDAYLRPSLSYAWSDALTVAGGANVMVGADATFFGQLERGSNAYLRVRYSF